MDFSAANTGLWNPIIQIGIIAGVLLIANILRRKIPAVRRTLLPTAFLAGVLLLLLRWTGLFPVDMRTLEILTYHGLALGFIAMSLRMPEKSAAGAGKLAAPKSGALIVSCYLLQGIIGLLITLGLAYTLMPHMFKAAGILLPMGYGQGPGQANNIGTTYEALGFSGGRSFGLSIAAAGYLSACAVGVLYLNVLYKKGKFIKILGNNEISGSVTVDYFQDEGEAPVSESVDRLSIQMALVVLAYLLTYLLTLGLSKAAALIGPGLAGTVNTLLWGFNFIFASVVAIIIRVILNALRKGRVMTHQLQNNYLLNRISGLAFDIMIVCGVASINFEDLSGLWLPFILMAFAGAIVTLLYLKWICKKVYPDYYYEGMLSMYGMMTGTISSGILLLREIDPNYKTPAANNLVTGSAFAVLWGAPMLALIGIAPNSETMTWTVLGLLAVYIIPLLLFLLLAGRKPKKK
jgi:ESS family glutamate:Na+ symporter